MSGVYDVMKKVLSDYNDLTRVTPGIISLEVRKL